MKEKDLYFVFIFSLFGLYLVNKHRNEITRISPGLQVFSEKITVCHPKGIQV